MANTTLAATAVAVLDRLFPDSTHGFDVGRRYHKVWKVTGSNGRSVKFFIEPSTGNIFKPATWKQPADKVRFVVESANDLEDLLRTRADAHGAWLYI